MLTTDELTRMRATMVSSLPGTAVIQAATKASDGQGGQTWSYAAQGTVPARIAPEGVRGTETPLGERMAEVSELILTVPHDTTIDEDDRVLYGSVTYEVVEVLTWTPWDLGRRVRVVEVD